MPLLSSYASAFYAFIYKSFNSNVDYEQFLFDIDLSVANQLRHSFATAENHPFDAINCQLSDISFLIVYFK